jgi:hypothetical protein
MGLRDEASLTARERAALANLEARVAADDPNLARRLSGRRRQIHLRVPALPAWDGPAWWCAPVMVIGLVLAAVGIATTMAVAVVGVLIELAGLRMLAVVVERRLRHHRQS